MQEAFKVPLKELNGISFGCYEGNLTPLAFLRETLWLLLWLDDLEFDFSLSLTGTENERSCLNALRKLKFSVRYTAP